MKKFLDENFLLNCDASIRLYHEYAAAMPIYDYHCHIPVEEIAQDRRFENITQVWLAGDHYKWRAMRACGVDERFMTGDAPDREKFDAWAAVVPQTICNPLFHWTHLELKRYFGVDDLLTPATADKIWNAANAKLASDAGSVRAIIKSSNVKILCTTDNPVDSLEHHAALAKIEKSWGVRVLPAFRPDAFFNLGDLKAWNEWVGKLAIAAKMPVESWDELLGALQARHDFFHEMGCRTADYGLEVPYAEDFNKEAAAHIFLAARRGERIAPRDLAVFRSALQCELLAMHGRAGWVQQLHLAAQRNNSTANFHRVGPDKGYDCIGDFSVGGALVHLLDRLEGAGVLAKTIVYSLNPKDNELLASVMGSFQGGVPGKMQLGTAWWFNDQKDGMERQLTALASIGLLSRFIGMLTDSRSFLSYPRHEYFRRILCEKLGGEMERGEIPGDFDLVGNMVKDICFRNAEKYFGIPLL